MVLATKNMVNSLADFLVSSRNPLTYWLLSITVAAGVVTVLTALPFQPLLVLSALLYNIMSILNGILLLGMAVVVLARPTLLRMPAERHEPHEYSDSLFQLAIMLYALLTIIVLKITAPVIIVFADILLFSVWTGIAAALFVLANTVRQNAGSVFSATGTVVAVLVFSGAWFYVPVFYGWDMLPMGWYAVISTSLPVLSFLSVLLCQYVPLFGRHTWLRRGVLAGLLTALIAGTAWQTIDASAASQFGRDLDTALTGRPARVRFADITNFEWDTLEIYDGYSSVDTLSPMAHGHIDLSTMSVLAWSDTNRLVVFIGDGKVAHYDLVPASWFSLPGEYSSSLSNLYVLSYDEAVFSVAYIRYEYIDGFYPKLTPM